MTLDEFVTHATPEQTARVMRNIIARVQEKYPAERQQREALVLICEVFDDACRRKELRQAVGVTRH